MAQKGHRYFSTIVCIFPAYYNFLKKHFDFFLLFPPGWKVFPPGWKVFQPGWKVFHPGGKSCDTNRAFKYVKRHYEISRVWDKEKIASQFSIGIPIGSSDSQL